MEHLLLVLLPSIERTLGHTDGNLVLAFRQTCPSFFGKVLEWHTNGATVLDIRLVLLIVKLCLNCRWKDLDDLDIPVLELFSQAEDEALETSSTASPCQASNVRTWRAALVAQ